MRSLRPKIVHMPVRPRATVEARKQVQALSARRARESLPTTDMYVGLHVGEVFYGNIGSTERLDFTVVGPAVNETSRIAAMCRSVDQPILVSATSPMSKGCAAILYRLAATPCVGSRSRRSFSHWIRLAPFRTCPALTCP